MLFRHGRVDSKLRHRRAGDRPLCAEQKTDPAVLCIDEAGRFVIPLLSGHIGGANALAAALAEKLDATAVVTTATDVRGRFAVDAWVARGNGCAIRHGACQGSVGGDTGGGCPPLQPVSPALPCRRVRLPGRTARWAFSSAGAPERLLPAPCADPPGAAGRRRLPPVAPPPTRWETRCRRCLRRTVWTRRPFAVSIPSTWSRTRRDCWPPVRETAGRCIYTAQQLRDVAGDFTPSDFVRSVTGVDNVCERAALLDAEKLIVQKTARTKSSPLRRSIGRCALGKVIVVGIVSGGYEGI